jgi:hypothetical protein
MMHRTRFVGLAVVAVLAISAMAAAASASAASEHAVQQWSHSIRVLSLPSGGCFNASYPMVKWDKVACKAAPDHPYLPARGPFPGEVGNGEDYSAEVSGLITSAIGSIPSVSAGASEEGIDPYTGTSEPNTFTLQLNSNFFASSPMCAGHGLPSACQGWQQFVYSDSPQESEVFMQYWLIQYNNTCPSGWISFSFSGSSEIYCYKNSDASTLSGARLTVSGLSGTTFEGSADVSGKDAVVLTTASGQATATGAGSVLSLGNGWKAAEFAIVGDCCGTQATFSANTTTTVHTVVKSSSDGPPTCVNEGFTGETNNLNLEGTPALLTQPFPTIASQQTNGRATAASCASVGSEPPTCTGSTGTLTLSPGLTNTPAAQTVKVKGAMSGCTGGPFAEVKYSAKLKTAGMVGCSVLKAAGEPASGAAKLKWTPKAKPATSTGTLAMLLSEEPSVAFSGEITAGSFSPLTFSGDTSETFTGGTTCGTKAVKKGTFTGTTVAFN